MARLPELDYAVWMRRVAPGLDIGQGWLTSVKVLRIFGACKDQIQRRQAIHGLDNRVTLLSDQTRQTNQDAALFFALIQL